jgi:hypothetical protein
MGYTLFFLIDSYTQECYPIFSLRLCHYLVISTQSNWNAIHHDKGRKDCPPVEIPPLNFWVDVRAQHNMRGDKVEQIKTIFDVQTDIVSFGVLVEKPDGSTVKLPPYTDIFSPEVDFVSKFRYTIPYDQAEDRDPIAGSPYYFTLLDIFGNPIPGSTKPDIWTGCNISAPSNFATNKNDYSKESILIDWDDVEVTNGFDPGSGVGFYQIEIGGWNPWTPDIYGSNLIKSSKHEVPWGDFEPPSLGNPDGFDLGIGLKRFTDGVYALRIEAFSEPPSGSDGQSIECVVVDFDQNIFFQKSGDNITFIHSQP